MNTITDARATLAHFAGNVDIAERLLARLPEDIAGHANISCSFDWFQLSNLDREQTERAMRALSAGRWTKKQSSQDGMLDYEATCDGLRVIIYGAPPSLACRIVEERVEVPAHTVTTRKVVCA